MKFACRRKSGTIGTKDAKGTKSTKRGGFFVFLRVLRGFVPVYSLLQIGGAVPVWVQNVVRIALIVAHLAGLVVAVILLVRRKGTAPILATVAFGLLVLLDAARIVQTALLPALSRQVRVPRVLPWIGGGMTCCCGLLDLVAWGCLIAAIWMGMGGEEGVKSET